MSAEIYAEIWNLAIPDLAEKAVLAQVAGAANWDGRGIDFGIDYAATICAVPPARVVQILDRYAREGVLEVIKKRQRVWSLNLKVDRLVEMFAPIPRPRFRAFRP